MEQTSIYLKLFDKTLAQELLSINNDTSYEEISFLRGYFIEYFGYLKNKENYIKEIETMNFDTYFNKEYFQYINSLPSFAFQDKEFVIEMAKKQMASLKYISKELQNDKEVVMEAIKYYVWNLQFASQELRDNKEVVKEALKINSMVLEYASLRLQNDKEVVMAAVKKNGFSLQFASPELQINFEICLEALKSNFLSIKYIPNYILEKKEFQIALIEKLNKEEVIKVMYELMNFISFDKTFFMKKIQEKEDKKIDMDLKYIDYCITCIEDNNILDLINFIQSNKAIYNFKFIFGEQLGLMLLDLNKDTNKYKIQMILKELCFIKHKDKKIFRWDLEDIIQELKKHTNKINLQEISYLLNNTNLLNIEEVKENIEIAINSILDYEKKLGQII